MIYQALKDSQVAKGELEARLRTLELNDASKRAQNRRRKTKDDTDALAEFHDEITMIGKRFTIMNECWVDAALFMQENTDWVDKTERYSCHENIQQSITSELYEAVPRKFHEMMSKHSQFAAKVTASLRSVFLLLVDHWTVSRSCTG